jgi:hypothetical protein
VGPKAGLDITKNIFLALPGMQHRLLDRPARSLVSIPTELPRLTRVDRSLIPLKIKHPGIGE